MLDPSDATKSEFKDIIESAKAIFSLTVRVFPFYMTKCLYGMWLLSSITSPI